MLSKQAGRFVEIKAWTSFHKICPLIAPSYFFSGDQINIEESIKKGVCFMVVTAKVTSSGSFQGTKILLQGLGWGGRIMYNNMKPG